MFCDSLKCVDFNLQIFNLSNLSNFSTLKLSNISNSNLQTFEKSGSQKFESLKMLSKQRTTVTITMNKYVKSGRPLGGDRVTLDVQTFKL